MHDYEFGTEAYDRIVAREARRERIASWLAVLAAIFLPGRRS